MSHYYDLRFQRSLDKALDAARLALKSAKCVKLTDEAHAYGDKFAAAEVAVRLATSSSLAFAELLLGLDAAKASQIRDAKGDGKLQLVCDFGGTTTYLREREREVDGPTVVVEQKKDTKGFFGGSSAKETSTKVTTKITEHLWTRTWSLRLVAKKDATEIVLLDHALTTTEATRTKENRPDAARKSVTLADADWLVSLDPSSFSIDRAAEDTKTPRRNGDVDAALTRLRELATFARQIEAKAFPVDVSRALAPGTLGQQRDAVFQPAACVALVEGPGEGATPLDASNEAELLAHCRTTAATAAQNLAAAATKAREQALAKDSEAPACLLDATAAQVLLGSGLVQVAAMNLAGALDHLEKMLYAQLRDAVGKELTPQDFESYMVSHERKLFKPCYRPAPLTYAVRRSATAFPDGSLSLEDSERAPVAALSRRVDVPGDEPRAVRLPLGASTIVECQGETYAHAYTARTFAGARPAPLQLVASARQFSSWILVLGTVTAVDEFTPAHAVVVSNKDEIIIPLLLDPLPAPKQFRDAIESLSPEQQDFCRAFRAMQLASSLFGILVVQVKPQLEAVLNLPPGSLTKEIELSSQLMDFLQTYSVPTDVLSFEGEETLAAAEKVSAVREHASTISKMVADARERDLAAKKAEAQAAVLDSIADEDRYDGFSMPEAEEAEECVGALMMGAAPPMMGAAPPGRSRGGGGGSYGGKGGRPTKMRSKRMGALRSTGGGCYEQDFGPPPPQPCAAAPPPPPRAAPASNSAVPTETPTPPRPQDTDDEPVAGFDVTALPRRLDAAFDKLDGDACLRPTTIKSTTPWRITSQKGLLSAAKQTTYDSDRLATEKRKAFELLDSLTRSGALPLLSTQLHVVVAATHAFDHDVAETVVRDNVNPILKAERSSLLVASTLFGAAPRTLVEPSRVPALAEAHEAALLDG